MARGTRGYWRSSQCWLVLAITRPSSSHTAPHFPLARRIAATVKDILLAYLPPSIGEMRIFASGIPRIKMFGMFAFTTFVVERSRHIADIPRTERFIS